MGGSTGRGAAQRAVLAALFGLVAATGWTPPAVHAQGPPPTAVAVPASERLTQPQLEQLLAPVALFPDDLLMQMLMAATYPLEVVQAKRWLGQGQNAGLKGDALAKALEAQPWDASVKSLVPFPDVLTMMNDQLDWTQRVGDALLAQQEDVLNTIQVLRGRAQEAGKLESGPQQTVNVTQNVTVAAPAAGAAAPVVQAPPQVITIAPTQPDQVFVPVYDPTVVFGTWPHPAYPPAYFPPPPAWGIGNAILTGMAFAGGVAVVNSLWGWARPGWGRGSVDIDVNRVNNINVNRNQITNNRWQHDVTHRHGVAYRDEAVRDRFRGPGVAGGAAADRAAAREQFRGRVEQGGGLGGRPGPGDGRPGSDRPGLGDGRPGGDRPGLGDGRPGGDRPGLGDGRPGGDRPSLGDGRPGGDRPGLGDGRLGGDRPALGEGRPGGERPGLGDGRPGAAALPARPPAAAARPSGDRPAAAPRPAATPAPANRAIAPSGRPQLPAQAPASRPAPSALQGIGQGQDLRAAQQRGQASRAAPVAARPQPAARPQQQVARPQPAAARGGGGRAAAARGGRGR